MFDLLMWLENESSLVQICFCSSLKCTLRLNHKLFFSKRRQDLLCALLTAAYYVFFYLVLQFDWTRSMEFSKRFKYLMGFNCLKWLQLRCLTIRLLETFKAPHCTGFNRREMNVVFFFFFFFFLFLLCCCCCCFLFFFFWSSFYVIRH